MQMILFPLMLVYLYGFITTVKFQFYLRRMEAAGVVPRTRDLNSEGKEMMNQFGYAVMWPLGLCFEPDQYKGLIYPSLHMWATFREEWPKVKAQRHTDAVVETDLRRSEINRGREKKQGVAFLEHSKAEVKHAREMEALRRDTEAFQERLIDDHPPELGEDEHYDPEAGMIVRNRALSPKKPDSEVKAEEAEVRCNVHGHWVKPSVLADPYNNCTDRQY